MRADSGSQLQEFVACFIVFGQEMILEPTSAGALHTSDDLIDYVKMTAKRFPDRFLWSREFCKLHNRVGLLRGDADRVGEVAISQIYARCYPPSQVSCPGPVGVVAEPSVP